MDAGFDFALTRMQLYGCILSEAHNKRDSRIYQEPYFNVYQRVQKICSNHKLNLPKELFMMDSTTVDLCLKLFPWARFRKKKAVEVHTFMTCTGSLPEFIPITDAGTYDAKGAEHLSFPTGGLLAVNKAHYNFVNYKQLSLITDN
jgi:hypothetical protein